MRFKLPKTFAGKTEEEMREAYERIINSPDAPNNQINPIIIPNQDLQFITDENLYNEIVKYLDKTFPAHKRNLSEKLSFDEVMKGSNPYIAVAVDMFLKQEMPEYRIATQRDLETNLQMFKVFQIDSGLALRSLADSNVEQATHLFNQLQKRNHNINFPIWVELRGLTLDNDLNFNLTDGSRYKTADCLNWEKGTHYLETDDFGLPKSKSSMLGRRIWTTPYRGLSRIYWYSKLFCNSSYLSNSDDNGRVVVVKPQIRGKTIK